MKILHVIETLSDRYGGPVMVVKGLSRALSERGLSVTILTTNAEYPAGTGGSIGWDVFDGRDIRVYRAPIQSQTLSFSWQLAHFISREIASFDLVHVHGLYRFPSTYAAWMSRSRKVPYIITVHGSLDPYLFGRSSAGSLFLKRLYERWFDLPNLRAAGAIHYTAEEERKRASFLGLGAPSFVVPNGLDWGRFRELPVRGSFRARWGLGESPLVLFLGRLHFKKGLDLLIPAFDALRHRVPNTHLVIAGPENDGYGENVRNWVRERELEATVHFVGPLDGADVVQAYVDADVFALPSYTENFGISVAEAMACALPVVISDQVNIHAEVTRAGAGLVTRCDTEETAGALTALLQNPARRRAMGEAGRRLIQARYTWPAIVEALTREYQAVIDRQRSSPEALRRRTNPRDVFK